MKLVNPTDLELDDAFANYVTKEGTRVKLIAHPERHHYALAITNEAGDTIAWKELPEYTKSADAVLPWLQKRATETNCLWSITIRTNGKFLINEGHQDESGPILSGDTEDFFLPRACVIALLRAHGVEIEFT